MFEIWFSTLLEPSEWHKSAPLCHPERRAKPGVEPVRATAGRDLLTPSAPTHSTNYRNGKPIRQLYPYPLPEVF